MNLAFPHLYPQRCCPTPTPVRKSGERDRVASLQRSAERTVLQQWRAFIANAKSDAMLARVKEGNVEGVLRALDAHISAFAAAHGAILVAVGTKEAEALSQRLTLRKADIALAFDPSDDVAADLMRQNKLRLVTALSQQQRTVVRNALVAGLRNGMAADKLARTFEHVIGLGPQEARNVQSYRDVLERGQTANALDRELRDRRFDRTLDRAAEAEDVFDVLTPDKIDRMVDAYATRAQRARAETIAITEAHTITVTARNEATRQGMQATGISTQLAGKEWNAVSDGRTRDSHAERDGMRRRLDEDFAPGIGKPGEGGAKEATNCRCVLVYEFFDTEDELREWLDGSS